MSALLNLTALGVPVIEEGSIPAMAHDLPACSNASISATGGSISAGLHQCVHTVEPPEKPAAKATTGPALLAWHGLRHLPWLHFRSMLWVHSAREAGRHPLPSWEEQLEPTPCRISYREDVLARARDVLHPALPPEYLAAHVRALVEARDKAERESEWINRLLAFVEAHQRNALSAQMGPFSTLYLATDRQSIVPVAAAALAALNISVISHRS